MADKAAAQQLKTACQGAAATVKKVERKDKSEKPPALYDLTTLQQNANQLLGFTAQQTRDYLQNLYEKKLSTYPSTDSCYLTSDMAASLPEDVYKRQSKETFARAISIPLQGDDFDSIRVEYMTMLQNQLAKGNNGLIDVYKRQNLHHKIRWICPVLWLAVSFGIKHLVWVR